jgi:hypothetical protein
LKAKNPLHSVVTKQIFHGGVGQNIALEVIETQPSITELPQAIEVVCRILSAWDSHGRQEQASLKE